MPQVAAAVAALDAGHVAAALRDGRARRRSASTATTTSSTADDLLLAMAPLDGYQLEREGSHAVALELALDDELRREGLAREVVHAVQSARQDAGLDDHRPHRADARRRRRAARRRARARGATSRGETLAVEVALRRQRAAASAASDRGPRAADRGRRSRAVSSRTCRGGSSARRVRPIDRADDARGALAAPLRERRLRRRARASTSWTSGPGPARSRSATAARTARRHRHAASTAIREILGLAQARSARSGRGGLRGPGGRRCRSSTVGGRRRSLDVTPARDRPRLGRRSSARCARCARPAPARAARRRLAPAALLRASSGVVDGFDGTRDHAAGTILELGPTRRRRRRAPSTRVAGRRAGTLELIDGRRR